MSLTLRPTDLASPVDRDRLDYTLFSGEWAIGRIYEDRGALPALRWYWALLDADQILATEHAEKSDCESKRGVRPHAFSRPKLALAGRAPGVPALCPRSRRRPWREFRPSAHDA